MTRSRLVYSTDGGRARPPAAPAAPSRSSPPSAPSAPSIPDDGVVRLFRDRGRRGGKVVTVVRGLPERGPARERIAGELKRFCGAGGTIKDGSIEIQGDHRERVAEWLRAHDYTVKLAGG
jgi:translation initiation factor 1